MAREFGMRADRVEMRLIGVLSALALFAVPVSAQTWSELRLRDERVLKDVKFVSQSPDSILVKHSEGLTQVKRNSFLPSSKQRTRLTVNRPKAAMLN